MQPSISNLSHQRLIIHNKRHIHSFLTSLNEFLLGLDEERRNIARPELDN